MSERSLQMHETAAKFKVVEKLLHAEPWFKKEKWTTSVHGFPASKPEFVTFHVSKKHWFNEDKQGIHFESYLAIDPKKRQKSYVTLHLLHKPVIPGTKLKRTDLARPVVDAVRAKIEKWDGFEFRAGAYGVQPFTKMLDGRSPDFEKVLASDLARLCKTLGKVIDVALIQLTKKN